MFLIQLDFFKIIKMLIFRAIGLAQHDNFLLGMPLNYWVGTISDGPLILGTGPYRPIGPGHELPALS